MQKHIFIIRHGETEFNRMGIVQGSGIDSSLNQKGLQQAQAFYRQYKNHFFSKIYISSLKRTLQTVQPFAEAGFEIEKHSALNEICWGEYEGTKIAAAPKPYFDDLMARWKNGETDIPIMNGESPLDVAIRQQPFLDLIFSRPEEKQILICMHGRAMRILLCQLLGKPLFQMDDFGHTNTSLYHLVYNYENDSIYAERENCVKHLEGIF